MSTRSHVDPQEALPLLRLGISQKLTLLFALFAAILLGATGWLAFNQGRAALESSVVAEVQSRALEKQAAIGSWLDGQLSELRGLSQSPHIVDDFTKLADLPADATPDDWVDLRDDLAARTGGGEDFVALFVMEPKSGRVLTATDPTDRGRQGVGEPYFTNGKIRAGLYLVPDRSRNLTLLSPFLSTPLRARNGAFVAVLVARLGTESLASTVDRRAGLRATDEAYLIDTHRQFVNRPRLLTDAEASILTSDRSAAARLCLEHNDGLDLSNDYRGVPAITVYRWMPKFGLCLITKLDKEEAFAPVYQLGQSLAIAGGLLLLVASAASGLLSRTITNPIRRIEAGARRVEAGERDVVLPESSSDELGRLARAFNRMTTALKSRESELQAHAATLEQRVAEKTRELDLRASELARSNIELERFASVASHDLQEPLRMVASYTQLLGRRYKGRLDADADEFIHFAVDGAARMQALINDLLVYSRVSTQGSAFEAIDCNLVVERALANLKAARIESGAIIRKSELPKIDADRFQLIQLFQNLIGNAIKFRGERVPEIEIAARRDGGEWLFSIADNGIGIDAKYIEQLFTVFKRLHTRAEYPGTGIGLAICKKVVERHGGRIWVESEVNRGSTFFFTLPCRDIEDTDQARKLTPTSSAPQMDPV
ncbi:sensor histidine kinase [Mesorhizobium dulcispinae]|uniref:sensor histidine kinase n=1 Tax=Mesorhizobium dulcispinae TaxID=3072316 RepID=UPI002A24B8B8|nr:ATP-binding protein [Mesorhizobium sp. VK23D]MDX8521238.1 ATP-binding protein [Mesorhizobium sp. VK23D]